MIPSRVEAVFNEKKWKFLARHFRKEKISSIKFQRMDPEILMITPLKDMLRDGTIRWTNYWGAWWFLFNKDGEKLATVGAKKTPWWGTFWWGDFFLSYWYVAGSKRRLFHIKESIGDAILRLGESAQEIHCIIREKKGALIIYKLPKDFVPAEWLEEQARKARDEVQKELAQIDSGVMAE